jgi:PAS domain S-box-containing protein
MDGFEVLKRLQQDEGTREIPVIFLTARCKDTDKLVTGVELGAFDYIPKPIEDDVLLARVGVAARVKQAEAEVRNAHDALEKRVEERTKELIKANEKLEQEIEARKQAEEALKKQLYRNEQILETMLDGYILADTNGKIMEVNPSYCNIIGYSREELLRMNIRDLEVKMPAEEIEPRIKQMVKQGFARFETKHKHKDGGIIDLEVSIVIMKPEESAFVAAFVHDFTERKQSEKMITESEKKYKNLVELATDIIYISDIDRNYQFMNDAGYKLLEAAPDEIIGKPWRDTIHPDDRERSLTSFRDMIKKGIDVFDFENRFMSKSGKEINVLHNVRVLRNGNGDIIGTHGIARDITEYKRVKEALEKHTLELEALSTLLRQVSLSLSLKQVVKATIEWINDAIHPDLALVFLKKGEELMLQDFAPKNTKNAHSETSVHRVGEYPCGLSVIDRQPVYALNIHNDPRCTWEECKKAGLHSFAALPLLLGDKVLGTIGLASSTPRDFEKQSVFLETIAREISIGLQNALLYEQVQRHAEELEQRVAERTKELTEAILRLREMDNLKSIFFASMSHELRTPLNSIIGYTGILLMGMAGELNEEQKNQLTRVKNNANHLLSLITDILDISKIEAGKVDIYIEKFKLSDVVKEVVETIAPLANEKGLEFSCNLPKGVRLVSDEKRLKQVLTNLVSNAVKYTDRGSVHITANRLKDNLVKVSVIDTGIGITREQTGRLFQPFQQLDASLTKKHGGTGLGLYLCKKLMTLLGGNISVNSEVGKGSEFTIILPIKYNEKI